MDDRVSSAIYNSFDPNDPSTVIGNQNLDEQFRCGTSRSIKTGLIQIGLFIVVAVVFAIFL